MAKGGNMDSQQRVDTSKFTPLAFPRSDGDPTKRPPNIDEATPDRDGEVNYHRTVNSAEPAAVSWRRRIAIEVARQLGMPEKEYILEDWPEDYEFYDHNKGHVLNPRHDMYLHGGPQKFRSTNEFIPHAVWLFTDEALNPSNCRCKYCTKSKTQSKISQAHGLSTSARESSAQSSRKAAPADFKLPVVPMKSHNPPRQLCSHKRVSDLRSKRWFREAEIVWVSVEPELYSELPSITSISALSQPVVKFWPAIIQDHSLKVDIKPGRDGGQYTTRHSYSYIVKLLALSQSITVSESAILPYQAYQPPTDLLYHLSKCPKLSLVTEDDMRKLSSARVRLRQSYVPVQMDLPPDSAQLTNENWATSIEAVATQLTLAIEIAAQCTNLWSPTDDWKFDGIRTAPDGTNLQISEMRFQGFWWGNERIWQEDLIRLRVRRDKLAPSESSKILPATESAKDRGVLLRVASVYFEAPSSVKASGMLYEVVDTDRQPSSADSFSHSGNHAQTNGQGNFDMLTDDNSSPSKYFASDPQRFDRPHLPSPSSPPRTNQQQTVGNIMAPHSAFPSTPGKSKAMTEAPSPSQHVFMSPPLQPVVKPNVSMPATLGSPVQLIPAKRRMSEMSVSGEPGREATPVSNEAEGSGLSYPPTAVTEGTLSQQYRFSLPDPPDGCVFRPILPLDQEVWVDLAFVAGRYYPHLSEAELLQCITKRPPNAMDIDDFSISIGHPIDGLQALCGLLPGHRNSIDAREWNPSRMDMVKRADTRARQICHEYWYGIEAPQLQPTKPPQEFAQEPPQNIMTAPLSQLSNK